MKPAHKFIAAVFAALIGFAVLLHAAGTASTNVTAKSVWVYPFENSRYRSFQNVTILQKTPAGITFKFGDRVIEHCGHYTIEN